MDRTERTKLYRPSSQRRPGTQPTRRAARTRRTPRHVKWMLRVLLAMGVLALLAVLLTPIMLGVAIVNASHQDETAKADAIVVLGAAQWDGQPSPDLQARLDHAADLYRAGYAPIVVLTGGSEPGDRYSEAEAGAIYLQGLGIPAGALAKVGGNDTIESLRQASAMLESQGKTRALMVSDPFHMFRVTHMASDLGLQPLSSPTRTSPFQPGTPETNGAIVREVFAYLAYLFLNR